MKDFIIKTFIFGLISGVLILLSELFISTRTNDYSYKYDRLMNHGDDIKYLMMGHSQAETSIIPSIIGDSIFNCAISGRNIYYDEVLLEKIIDKLPNLECVTYPLMCNTQYFPSDTAEFIDKYRNIILLNNKFLHIPFKGTGHWESWFAVQWNPLLLYEVEKVNCDSDGYLKTKRRNDGFIKDINTQQHVDETIRNDNCRRSSFESLRHMARLCRDHNVRFILYTIPHHKSMCFTQAEIMDMHQWAQAAMEVYPQTEYYDYINDTRFTDEDLLNETHLQDCGARKFTKIIAKDWFGLNIQ